MRVILFILIAVSTLLAGLSRSAEVVNDSVTGLEWQDDAAAATTYTTWQGALDYCEALPLDGGGWRLPNKKELLSIADRSRYSPAIDNTVFVNTASSNYWSSTTNANSTIYAWKVHFSNGYSSYGYKGDSHYVRCVRGGQFGNWPPVVKMPPSVIMYLLN